MKRWCSRRLECGCCRARAPCATKEVPRDMGSTGSAVIFVFLGQGVAGGSVSVGTISLCFMSCHKKKGKGSKMRGGGTTQKEKRKKTNKKKQSEPAGFPRLCGTTGHFCRLWGCQGKL